MNSVEIEHVSKSFGSFKAVSDVSLTIGRGEFVTLLGASGCGKTTTLRMLAGLEENDGGRIVIEGTTVSDPAAGIFRPPEQRGLGMVFQSYAIWPHMTVFENVAYPLTVRRMSSAVVKEKVQEALRLVEMSAFADRPAPALSGGQQQRVAIARALVSSPSVLLLDEPLSNLDARLRRQTGAELRRLQQKTGVTAVYVTHDQDEAMSLSDRVVVMDAGRILQQGTPVEVYDRPMSPAVATFFGDANLVESDVLEMVPAGDLYRLRVRNPMWEGYCYSKQRMLPGDKVIVMIRSENLRIAPSGTDALIEATVSETMFRGAIVSVVAETKGGPLHIDLPAGASVTVGDAVRLTAQPEQVWAMPRP